MWREAMAREVTRSAYGSLHHGYARMKGCDGDSLIQRKYGRLTANALPSRMFGSTRAGHEESRRAKPEAAKEAGVMQHGKGKGREGCGGKLGGGDEPWERRAVRVSPKGQDDWIRVSPFLSLGKGRRTL